MYKYLYAIVQDDVYDIDQTFDNDIYAIELALQGYEIAVLDAFSLEYYGTIK